MVNITDHEQLEEWLEGRPRADAVLIGARAALRVFPLLAPLIEENAQDRRATVILPVFRATAVASAAGTWPALATEVASAAAAAAACDAASARAVPAAFARAVSAASAARASAYAAAYATHGASAASAVAYASEAAEAVSDAAYSALAADATELGQDIHHAALATMPLWKGRELRFLGIGRIGSTNKPPDVISRAWTTLRTHLERAGDNWQVWIDWYQDRLDGKPADRDLELAKMLIPNETWEAGPAVVNAEIARLIDRLTRGEDEDPDAFEDAETQKPELDEPAIDDAFTPPEPKPAPARMLVEDGTLQIRRPDTDQIEELARDGWAALCEETDELARQMEGKSGNNELLPHLKRARRALGDAFDDLNVVRFGLAALTIEQFAQEAENLGMLMPEQAAPLRSIVLQKNLLLAHSPAWAAYIAAIEPPIADAETEQEAANLAVEINREITVEHGDAVTPEAQQLLEELASATQIPPSPDNPEGIASPEARRSLLRAFSEEMRAFALDIVAESRKLLVKGTAATVVTGSIAVVTSVSTKLLGLADKLPQEYAWLKDLVYYAASLVGA